MSSSPLAARPPAELAIMPNEIILCIADNFTLEQDIANLANTNRHFHDLLTPYLYSFDVKYRQAYSLWWGVWFTREEVVRRALVAGADVNRNPPEIPASIPHHVKEPNVFLCLDNLHGHAGKKPDDYRRKRAVILKLLIDSGLDIDATTDLHLKQNAIQRAGACGENEVVRLLIENGANFNYKSSDESTLLHYAAGGCDAETLDYLIGKGLDAAALNVRRESPLHAAAYRSNQEGIIALARHGAPVDCVSQEQQTPLILAAEFSCCLQILKVLLDRGANPNHVGPANATPLHKTILAKNADGTRLLIECGADVNAKMEDGNTPLQSLLRVGAFPPKLDLVRLLVEKGADVNHTNSFGCSLVHTAVTLGEIESLQLIIDLGADVNKQDEMGYTPLHLTNAPSRHQDLAIILLENGADDSLKNNRKIKALSTELWQSGKDNRWVEEMRIKYRRNRGEKSGSSE